MVQVNKRIGVSSPVPGFAPDMDGAPATVPGGNDGTDKTKMTGTPVKSATLPPAFSSEISGAPEAGKTIDSPMPVKTGPAPAEPNGDERQKKEAVAGYDDIISMLEKKAAEYAPETPEQREKRERREKSARIISAVSDGLSALSNLYFTTQYAPNMYNHEKGSQLTPLQSRIERAKRERESDADKYLQFALRLGDTKNERAKTLRELEAQQERRRLAREKAEREAEAHGWSAALQPDKQREQKGKADRAEYEADTARVKSEYEPKHQQADLDLTNAKIKTEGAKKRNYVASAGAHDRSNVSEYRGLGKDGKFKSFEKRQAAIDYERRQGTYDPARWGDDLEEVVKTEKTDKTHKTTRKSKVKPVKGKGYGDNDNKGY